MKNTLSGGNSIHVILILVLVAFGYNMVGGQAPGMPESAARAEQQKTQVVPVVVNTDSSVASDDEATDNLQLKTFTGVVLPTAGPPARTCNTNEQVNVMITLDYSGSMKGDKLIKAKKAAKKLVDILETNPTNKVGINSFAGEAKMYINLTDQHTLVKAVIDNMPEGSSGTCIKCGIEMANAELASTTGTVGSSASTVKNIDILLTDGHANHPEPKETAIQQTIDAAQQGHSQSGIIYYTVGFGSESGTNVYGQTTTASENPKVNDLLLRQIASDTKGKYYYSPTDDHLEYIFEDIGLIICN